MAFPSKVFDQQLLAF